MYWTVQRLGHLVKECLTIEAVPTSIETEKLATQLSIPLHPYNTIDYLDLTMDAQMKSIPIYN
ncbi:hypothetical protein MX160_08785 [Bacillus cytotoxicus]|uniref:Uncharacterized protein n=1 Tax=Bacillus cytotoxicus TaxID=580165 RepID=A0AAX2CH12_9BACI|nr:hypothetical protein [Bacillus cytotoxicus]MDH2888211.1 hypothetical protein [Bacillus cytotoxicus]SCL93110.1 Protein of unknown function [Bacillus cytotoxicus]